AQRELEEERRRQQQQQQPDVSNLKLEEKRSGPDIREFEHADVIKGVYFTCELLGDDEAMTKPELMQALEEFLMSQLHCEDEDAVVPAVLLLYSLNKKPAREVAVETIGKYLQNIIENPGEAKYRRIRMSNKVFQVRLLLVVRNFSLLGYIHVRERKLTSNI
ncbi:PUB domain protein, partial [Cooperia oncophora]